MKTRYDVSKMVAVGSMRFEDLKDAFAMAKAMARHEGEEIVLRKLVWDDTNRVSRIDTVLVNAEGHFRYSY